MFEGIAVASIAQELAIKQQELKMWELMFQLQYQALINSPVSKVTTKCSCCGSMAFRYKDSVRICSYCRSEQ